MFESLKLKWKQKKCSHEWDKPRVLISLSGRYGQYTPPKCKYCGLVREIPHDSVGQQIMQDMFRRNIPPHEL